MSAGVLEGASEGKPDEPLARQAAGYAARPVPIRAQYRPGSRRDGAGLPAREGRRSRPASIAGECGGLARPIIARIMIPSGLFRNCSSRARLRAVAASTTTPSSGSSGAGVRVGSLRCGPRGWLDRGRLCQLAGVRVLDDGSGFEGLPACPGDPHFSARIAAEQVVSTSASATAWSSCWPESWSRR